MDSELAGTTPLSSGASHSDSIHSAPVEKHRSNTESRPHLIDDSTKDENAAVNTNEELIKDTSNHNLSEQSDGLTINQQSQDATAQNNNKVLGKCEDLGDHADVETPSPESRYLARRPRLIMASAFAIANLMVSIDSSILGGFEPYV
jgi:hypothetical protein